MRNKTTIFIFFLTILISCGRNKNPCSLSEKTMLDIARLDSVINVPEIRERIRRIDHNEYGELSLIDAKAETYRFTLYSVWSFWKVVRIEKREDNYHATVKQFGLDTSYTDTLRRDQEFDLSKDKWNKILDGLNKDNFWTYQTTDGKEGLDGATWTLEGYKPIKDPCTFKNYHRIYRWSPSDTTFVNMCLLLYDLKPD
jgi:hypothetical protein